MKTSPVWFCLVIFLLSATARAAEVSLTTRGGDRCVTLHWKSLRETRIFRGTAPEGPFREMSLGHGRTGNAIDFEVENGRTYYYQVEAAPDGRSELIAAKPQAFRNDDDFLEFIQATAFDFFWFEANPANGLIRDRSTTNSFCSIAAVGFGLTALGIGVDHGWITRRLGAERALRTLRTLAALPQGGSGATAGYKGWFYHFLDMETGLRFRKVELSSIDTALLMAGVLYVQKFFDQDTPAEREIGSLAQRLFERVDWRWMLNGGDTLAMGWHPESGFIRNRWKGYNEASILYVLGLGAEKQSSLAPEQWTAWTATYKWETNCGTAFIPFPPLFGHQYSACWIDFRQIQDDYTRARGITYFENSRRATLAQRAYAEANPGGFPGYSSNLWGFTACDGPGRDGALGYAARGAPPPEHDDGTIAPTAPGGSLPFAPAECVAALREMYARFRAKILCPYGFRDAFNLGLNWWDPDVVGIDQGPILIMAENLRTGRVWQVMHRSVVLHRGLERAGFRAVTLSPTR